MQVDIDLVEATLRQAELDPVQIQGLISDIKERAALSVNPPAPRQKWEPVILLSDPNREYREVSLVGWALQVREGETHTQVADSLIAAANDFNMTPKGRRLPVKTIGETIEGVSRNLLKERGVKVLSKEPLSIIPVDNALPQPPPSE